MWKKIYARFFYAAVLLSLAGCDPLEGVGKSLNAMLKGIGKLGP